MKVAIYSPYLDTVGGGERYMLSIAEILSKKMRVDLLLDSHLANMGIEKLEKNFSNRLNLNLSKVRFIKGPLGQGGNFIYRYLFLKEYDLLFFLTDGSFFYTSSKKSFIHIQTPLKIKANLIGWNKYKLSSWNKVIYNSKFTKENCQDFWPIKSSVIYPPVDTVAIRPLKKKKVILSVGRFFGFLREKKHPVMIKSFGQLIKSGQAKGWSFYLVGGASAGDKPYLEELRKIADGLPVIFYPNLEYRRLIKLYGEASIYWHATGFGEEDPTKMEHFGITTVEAMAGGAVPVVINKGGQKEIVENSKSGFLWDSLEELKSLTLKLIGDEELMKKMSNQTLERSKLFSKEKFQERILSLAND